MKTIVKNKTLDIAFEEAVKRVNGHMDPFPADFLLRIYAYYKKARKDVTYKHSSKTIIDAFKTNALLQVSNVTEQEAKEKYIELVDNYFLHGKTQL